MRRYLFLGCLLLAGLLFADDWFITETARSAGMGNAFTAIGDGVESMVYNPAGLYISPRHQVMLTYSKDYAGLDYGGMYQASLLYTPINKGWFNWGLGVNMFAEDVYERLNASLAFGGRIARIGGKKGYISLFGIGNLYRVNYNSSNFEYIPDDGDVNPTEDPIFADGYDKMNFGGDVAFMFAYQNLKIGGRLANINEPNLSLQDVEAGKYPRMLRTGIAYTFKNVITPSFDYQMPLSSDVATTDEATYFAGLEGWLFNGMIGLRGGMNENAYTGGLSLRKMYGFGAGVDYAIIFPKLKSGAGLTSHKVSVNLSTPIPPPPVFDLVADSIKVTPDILSPELKGKITAKISNLDKDNTKSFDVVAYYKDSDGKYNIIEKKSVDGIKGKSSDFVDFDWKPANSGEYEVFVNVDDDGSSLPALNGMIDEKNEENNTASHIIPSYFAPNIDGINVEQMSLNISQVSFIKEEIPIHPEVYFDDASDMIHSRFDRLLETFAKRLYANPDVVLELRGYYDPFTEADENVSNLVNKRAKSVKDKLVEFGAPADRVSIVSKDYEPSETKAGQKGKKPNKSFLELVAAENRRVEFKATMPKINQELAKVSVKQNDKTIADESRVVSAAEDAASVLRRNPDIALMLHSIGDNSTRESFDRVKSTELQIEDRLGYSLRGRTFAAFSDNENGDNQVILSYSAEPFVYKPITQSNIPEGFKIAEEKGNNIELNGIKTDAPLDTFYLVVKDSKEENFAVLSSGKENIPESFNWNWRSNEGEPPNPSRKYNIEFYMRDILGRETSQKSGEISINAEKMEHKEELVLINFNFAGTTPQSKYIESRIENVAREIVDRTKEPIKSMEIIIGGHTDVIGSPSANKELSLKRADREYENLRAYLIKYLGLSDDAALDQWLAKNNTSIKTKGYGSEFPYEVSIWERGYYKKILLGQNEYPEGRILNRRVSAQIRVEM